MTMSVDVLRYAAFTRDGRGGNPAGVVLDAAGMSETAMQAVAADVGYSETAFLLPGATLGIRYFSPRAEVSFCGHATVATAVAVAERDGAGQLELRTGVGPVPVRTERGADGVLRATLTSVPTSTVPADPREVGATLAALRWASSDLDPALPPHVSYAGAYHLVLATTSRARLATCGTPGKWSRAG
ncbi:MAG: PhzF family phenazine biosynthesis protein, partial [Pseudonocardiaceae bacterium]